MIRTTRLARRARLVRWTQLAFVALALTACGSRHTAATGPDGGAPLSSRASAPEEKVLNVYNWSDYIAPDTVPNFEKEYGIKVNYDKFDSNDVLQTKLLAGRTGYDIVVPSANFLALQIQAGVFQKLDKSLLPNLRNVDPEMAKKFEPLDPGMQYAVNYFWGTSGVGYNVDKIKAAMPDAPVDSFRMFYDPEVVKHFKDCGVTMLDEPDEVLNTVFIYLNSINAGKPGYKEIAANSTRLEDLEAAKGVLMRIRPYIRYINSSKYIDDLATGEICLALGWNGDVGQAGLRAREANNGITVKYLIPKEGAVMFFDMLAIPADAPHPKNAHLFINYLLRPEVSAKNSSAVHFASSNAAAYPLIDPIVYNDRGIFPSPETAAHLTPNLPRLSSSYNRAMHRMWTSFKSGH